MIPSNIIICNNNDNIDIFKKEKIFKNIFIQPASGDAGISYGSCLVSTLKRKKLKTKRIGHGVRCVEDPELVNYLSENDYHLEICLTSNIKTNTFKTFEDHPLNKIYNSSISLSLNTDGRTISNTDLSLEYKIAEEKFDWTIDKIKKCNLEAIKHSFTSSSNKSKLIKKIINFNY